MKLHEPLQDISKSLNEILLKLEGNEMIKVKKSLMRVNR